MIIDLLNYCQNNPGTEASILYRLQENGINVPSFFCITEDYTEDELNNYLSNHYQHTTNFTVRLSLSAENNQKTDFLLSEVAAPHYVDIPKSILVRYADRLFAEAKDFIQQTRPDKKDSKVTAHVIVQEMVHANVFGCMQTACNMGVMNETIILVGEGHDSDFAERGVPFSIYCHNDDDGILYAHEPENAARGERNMIQKLLQLSGQLKLLFNSYKLEVKFIADYKIKRLYLISVQKISALSDDTPEHIVLDTKGICNYYPGVTNPLLASMVQKLFREIMQKTFSRITNKPIAEPKLLEPIVYVNGRLYFHTQRLNRIQELLFFHEESEEFVNRSVLQFWKHFWKKHGILHWYQKRKMALGLQSLLECNLTEREEQLIRFQKALDTLTQAGYGDASYEHLFAAFEEAFEDLADCVRANLFNTLYINMNRKLMNRLKPSDKKYKHAADTVAVALKYRSVLRAYHAKFMEQITEYAKRVGAAFVEMGYIEHPSDIHNLTMEQVYALRSGSCNDLRSEVCRKSQELTWYKSMPSFSRLVFYKEIINAPVGTVDFLDTLTENCYLRGSGLVEGNASYSAVVCADNRIPDNPSPQSIYIVHSLTPDMSQKSIGGLVAEKADVFANLNLEVANCRFPIVTGAEHACTLIQNGDLIDLNGSSGEVNIRCMANCKTEKK